MELNDKVPIATKDGKQFIIRRISLTDRSALQRFGSMLSEKSTATFLPHPYDNKTLDAFLLRSELGKDLTLGLFNKEDMIGYFFLWNFNEKIPLLGIGLLDLYQGLGLGRLMMEFLIEAARNKGCDGIELTTLPENYRAFYLYESLGFQHYADVENLVGDSQISIERAMFLQFNPYASPSTGLHKPPVDLLEIKGQNNLFK